MMIENHLTCLLSYKESLSMHNNHKNTVKNLVLIPLLVSTFFFGHTANAQKLEEIIVTAQKRAESLQDVSVSVTALDGEKLSDFGVARLEEITAYVPNFVMSETGIGTNIYIRGIGSGINQGFEQSVGMYRDGIYYGRAQLARSPLFDMERVEVLRGPQVTLFGNNSIGGAVSITTAPPTDEFEASLGILRDFDHGEREKTFIVSGPIDDQFSARFSLRSYELEGYIDNQILNEKEPARDYLTKRLKFQFEPRNTDLFNSTLTFEESTFDVKGRQIVVFVDEPSTGYGTSTTNFAQKKFGQNRPTLNEILTNNIWFPRVGADTVIDTDDFSSRYSNKDFSKNKIYSSTLTTNFFLGDAELKIINGLLKYNYEDACDCDFTGAELIQYESDEDYRQVSHEIRLTSPSSDRFEFITGLYYQRDSLNFNDALIAEADTPIQDFISGTFGPDFGVDLTNISGPRNFEQNTNLYSAFGQATFHIREDLRLMAGIRRSKTEKSAFRRLTYRQIDRETPIAAGAPSSNPFDDRSADGIFNKIRGAFSLGLLVSPHIEQGTRKEWRNSYALIAEWDMSDDLMGYASRVRGFKSGGYDVRSNNPTSGDKIINNDGDYETVLAPPSGFTPGTFEFQDEEAIANEIGIKASIADMAEVNVAYFYTEIKNLQVSVFDGGVGFNVSNAAKAVTQGIEIDGRIALSERVMISGSLAWMDFEFKNYQGGVCSASDRLALDPLSGNTINEEIIQYPGPDGVLEDEVSVFNDDYIIKTSTSPGIDCTLTNQDGFGPLFTADLSGKTNQYVSSYSGALSVNFEDTVLDDYLFRASLDINFTGPYHPTQNMDESIKQDGYEIVNLRLGLGSLYGKWDVALIGRNIFDTEIISYANDVPLSSSQFGTITKFGFVQRTKSWALQAKYSF